MTTHKLSDFDTNTLFVAYQSMLRGGVPSGVVADLVKEHIRALCDFDLENTKQTTQSELDEAIAQYRAYLRFLISMEDYVDGQS